MVIADHKQNKQSSIILLPIPVTKANIAFHEKKPYPKGKALVDRFLFSVNLFVVSTSLIPFS